MSPDVVVCDEIGSSDDVIAIEQAINSGVRIIATVHTSNAEELRQKENIMSLLRFGAFSKIVFLSDRTKIGQVSKISEVGEFLDT